MGDVETRRYGLSSGEELAEGDGDGAGRAAGGD